MAIYRISRAAPKPGKQLSMAQRMSPLYQEEPRVLGRVLRRGSPPFDISEQTYENNLVRLRLLEKAEAIHIERIETEEDTKALSEELKAVQEKNAPLIAAEILTPPPAEEIAPPAPAETTPVETAPEAAPVQTEESIPGLPAEPTPVETVPATTVTEVVEPATVPAPAPEAAPAPVAEAPAPKTTKAKKATSKQ